MMNVILNNEPWHTSGFTPTYLSDLAYNSLSRNSSYSLSVVATSDSTLPPILNAAEIFTVFPTTNLSTDSQDGMTCKNRKLISHGTDYYLSVTHHSCAS
jgi:hypothetical protein